MRILAVAFLSVTIGSAGPASAEKADAVVASRCAPLYPKDWQPVLGQDKQRPGRTAKPARGKPFIDPLFKTCVVRATDHAADEVTGFARTDYSRRQSFNADSTKFIVGSKDGSWHHYDARTLKYGGQLPGVGSDAEVQWHPTNPNILYHLPPFGIGMQILELNIANGKSRVVADLSARIKAVWPKAASAWTRAEGSPSADFRYWTLMVDDKDWHGLGILTYDLSTDSIIAAYDFAKNKKGRPDHVSTSPSGAYAVCSWEDGTYAFTRDFSKAVKLHTRSEHSDLALDTNGDDVYVSIDYEASGGYVFTTNIRTGVRTLLFPTYLERTATALHVSGKAFLKPGWVLLSTYKEVGGPWQWLHGKVFAVELKPNPRIVNIAHHHVAYNEYFTEPHASVNREFTRIVFNSNWDNNSKTDVDTFMVELPLKALPPPRR